MLNVFTFNPPAVQVGVGACFGYANPIREFGDTPETEELIEQPFVQKKLLKAEVPYKCERCGLIFFVQRRIIDMYIQAYQWANVQEDNQPPRDILCQRAYHVDLTHSPPQITKVNHNITISKSVTTTLSKQINLSPNKPSNKKTPPKQK